MRRITPDMPPAVAQRIANEESGDLKARWMLVDLAEAAYNENHRAAAASLAHAFSYLENREEYERNPYPKGTMPYFATGKLNA